MRERVQAREGGATDPLVVDLVKCTWIVGRRERVKLIFVERVSNFDGEGGRSGVVEGARVISAVAPAGDKRVGVRWGPVVKEEVEEGEGGTGVRRRGVCEGCEEGVGEGRVTNTRGRG